MVDKNIRDASYGFNGFNYQRDQMVYSIIKNINNDDVEYILEEGHEDNNVYKFNKKNELTQVKYHDGKDASNESITDMSGLYKMIISNFQTNNISKMIYISHSTIKPIYQNQEKKLFKNKKKKDLECMGKYIIMIACNHTYKKNNKSKIKKNIDNTKYKEITLNITYTTDEINEIYKNNKSNIKYIANIFEDNNDIFGINLAKYDFFKNKNKCIEYFNKFHLDDGDNHLDLIRHINEEITIHYNKYITMGANNYRIQQRIDIIREYLKILLCDTMFNYPDNPDKRKIPMKTIKTKIDKIINNETIENITCELYKYKAINIIDNIQHTNIPNHSYTINIWDTFDIIKITQHNNSHVLTCDHNDIMYTINYYHDMIRYYYSIISSNIINKIKIFLSNCIEYYVIIQKNKLSHENLKKIANIKSHMHNYKGSDKSGISTINLINLLNSIDNVSHYKYKPFFCDIHIYCSTNLREKTDNERSEKLKKIYSDYKNWYEKNGRESLVSKTYFLNFLIKNKKYKYIKNHDKISGIEIK